MGFFSNVLSLLSISAGSANAYGTIFVWLDEPECPKELL